MPQNLLQGVNSVLKKVQIVNSNNELTSLTNSAKQIFIDNAVSAWGEAVDQIYSKAKMNQPNQAEEDTITLVEGQREYDLPCDLVQLRWPLHDETEGRYINKYPGGWEELRNVLVQPENYTGQPTSGAISPIDGTIYLDNLPTSAEAGDIYRYTYWKDLTLKYATDTFPFTDTVFRALVPVVTEIWKYYQHNRFQNDMVKVNYGRAVRALKQEPRDASWITRPGSTYVTNPLGHDPYHQ